MKLTHFLDEHTEVQEEKGGGRSPLELGKETLNLLFHLIPQTILWDRSYYHHLTDGKLRHREDN